MSSSQAALAGPVESFERGPRVDFDLATPLDGHVAAQVGRTPDAIALSDGVERVTFAEMWTRSGDFAAGLAERGVARGDVVAVCMERSVRLPIALLGILRLGAAYCPLDPGQPPARLRHAVEQSGPALLVASDALRPLGERVAAKTAGLDVAAAPGRAPNPVRSCPPRTGFNPDDTAYVIFTSGSTGRPKGVAVPHRGVVNRLLWMQRELDLGPDDTVLQKTPLGFDVSVWELFWPLLAGARLHLAAPDEHLDPRCLAETVAAEEVTTIHFVPSMLALFLQQPLAGCGSLRRVVCSGEALAEPLMRRALETFAPARLFNLYGPTEASIDVTWWPCRLGRDTVPIGRPIANVDCYVVDENGERVGVGESGELCVGGVQVARGYVGQPEATGERFVQFDWAPGTVYRTGDVVRWTEEGLLEFLGRADRQLKLNGLRVEPGEIEALIEAVPGVAGAAVVLRSDLGGSDRLVAYAVPEDGAPGPPEIRKRLLGQLTLGMVPSFIVMLDSLPVTANGKLDRDALPRPAGV